MTDWLIDNGRRPSESQIAEEIDYFKNFYKGIKPKVFLSTDLTDP